MITPWVKAWRGRQLKKRYPKGRVTPHLRYKEFYTRDGTPIPANDQILDALEKHCRMIIEPMRKKFGPVHVLSGYRHRSYNASIGGASNSYHIWDQRNSAPATDLVFAKGSPREWAAYAEELCRKARVGGGIGTYMRMGFVHVDMRPGAARWRGSGE